VQVPVASGTFSKVLVSSKASAVIAVILATAACGSAAGVTSGGQCFLATDCAAGLICIAKGSIRICSSDTTTVETMIDGGMDAQSGDGGALPSFDSGPTVDVGTSGDSAAAPLDAGHTVDAMAPEKDAGTVKPADATSTG